MPDLNRSLLSEGENADTLGSLTDVTITTPEEFQSLVYNGTGWVNGYAPTVSYVRNAEANTLTTGTVVYLFGGTGDHATVKRADNDSDATSAKTMGVVAANIAASENGPVVTRGYVDGFDLSMYTVGDTLYLGEDGGFTTTKPVGPEHLVYIGVVVRATINGILYVAAQNGYELDELHNVAISNVAAGEFLKFNGTLWVNDVIDLGTDTNGNYVASVAAGTGIDVSNTGVEGGTFTVNLANTTVTANSYGGANKAISLTVDAQGRLTAASDANIAIASSQVTNFNEEVEDLAGGLLANGTHSGISATYDDANSKVNLDVSDFTITLGGDLTGNVTITNLGNATLSATIAPNSVALGTDTTGNYVSDVSSGTGITVTHTPGEGSNATIAVNTLVVATLTDSQTLSNKTLSSATLTGTLTANGGVGTAGQVLKSTGTGVEWGAGGGTQATSTTVNTASATEIYSFDPAQYGTGELTIQTTQGSKRTSLKALVNHNSTDDAKITTYGILEYGSPIIPLTISADYAAQTLSWVTQTSNFGNTTIAKISYGDNIFVAGGAYSNQIRTSTDGITWVTRTAAIPASRTVLPVFGNNVWVGASGAFGGPATSTSTDAITWVTQTSNFGSTSPGDIAFGNGLFLVGMANGTAHRSTDGITWVTSVSGSTSIYGVAYGNVWAYGANNGVIQTSTDAITWTTQTSNFGTTRITGIAYGNSLWVAVGQTGQLRTSTDAITWITQTSNFGTTNIRIVQYANNIWIAGGESGQLRISTDAITWVTRTSNFGTTHIRTFAYGNSLWVAGGYTGQIRTSYGGNTKVSITATITDANTTQANVKVLPTLLEV